MPATRNRDVTIHPFSGLHRWQALVLLVTASCSLVAASSSPIHIISSKLQRSSQTWHCSGGLDPEELGVYSRNSAMRGAIRPVALSARAVLRSRPLGHHSHNPFQPRLLQSNTLHPRAFWTSSPTWRAAAAAEAEAPGPVHEQEEGRETRPRDRDNAQKQVDDRPWHREGSHSQPESTVRDPAGHDQTKGEFSACPNT